MAAINVLGTRRRAADQIVQHRVHAGARRLIAAQIRRPLTQPQLWLRFAVLIDPLVHVLRVTGDV
jgi:hypothetical protein